MKKLLKDPYVVSFEVKCGNTIINNVNEVKYLGLQIDNNLSGDFASMTHTSLTYIHFNPA